ncbi:Ig-like domain-containing protein [Modestobacter sp. VKM Ac-2985]|uniref:Ig-like domain-containing protein n=1 Tax=Modestobacter sp. VKM Ac-2985 TaxID=3004139 RepID=UPI0022AB727F|nr:Ig-like domain-containing protein [Modestobacter sp. VKM Ac-2985]MCZ2836014.1 Ig-like domain-containing protein [Modestobacter sp. VKM Ac-2985]
MASIAILSPAPGARVRGTVEVRVQVRGGSRVSTVTVAIGDPGFGTRQAESVGDRTYAVRWDTTRKLVDPDVRAPADALFWITASAVVDGIRVEAPYVAVVTANDRSSARAESAGGWREELAWAADYSGSTEQWLASNTAVIGAEYASVEPDPVLGPARRAVRVSVPDSARGDRDQPTSTTVRFQSSSVSNIREGDEFCVGFAFLPPADFPSVHPRDGVLAPGGDASGYIAVFQFYGPPYEQGSPFVLHTERRTPDDPIDEFSVRGNELNPGDPVPFLSLPYRRGQWTDVVFRIRASSSIRSGWVECHVNQGESTAVRPMHLADGRLQVPRVLLRPDSADHRTDMQLYRVAGRFDRVTLWHTGHRIARTVSEADPGSYRNGVPA